MGKELKSFFKNNFPNFLRSKLFFSKNIMILKKFKEEKKKFYNDNRENDTH
jgi:hypothetical protein